MSDLIRVEAGLLALPTPALNNCQKKKSVISAASAEGNVGRGRDGKPLETKHFLAPDRVRMPVDPDKPTGPPPTFETNLLEAGMGHLGTFGQALGTEPLFAFSDHSVAVNLDFDPEKYAAVAKATAAPQTSGSPKIDILR
ncbi:MAG: hypothetical protein WBO29_04810 [Albidovulum sp.]